MANAGLEKLVWVLIYGGLLAGFLGAFTIRRGAGFGWVLVTAGIGLGVTGAVLIWVRSRRPGDRPDAQ